MKGLIVCPEWGRKFLRELNNFLFSPCEAIQELISFAIRHHSSMDGEEY